MSADRFDYVERRYLGGPKKGEPKPGGPRSLHRDLSEKQMAGLQSLDGHGNTMWSLERHGLVAWDHRGGRWLRRIRGVLILEGWTLDGLDAMPRHGARGRPR